MLPPLPAAAAAAAVAAAAISSSQSAPAMSMGLTLPPHRDLGTAPAAPTPAPVAPTSNGQAAPQAAPGQELTLEQQYITAVEGIVPTLQ